MTLWLLAFAGGLIGTIFMDTGARWLAKAGLDGALGGLLGRWVIGFGQARWVIDGTEELQKPETTKEARVGFVFHYIVGGGVVALFYPLWFALSGMAIPTNHLIGGAIFGLISVLLTWFLQYPCFGFSWFGLKAPTGSSTIVAPAILHTAYGLGIGITMQIGNV